MRRVLIANRGEIGVRIARACREAGLSPVAVYSEADANAAHVRAADAAVCVGPPPSRDSYLKIDALLDAARRLGADAVHPGYGFLAESAEFAGAVTSAGLTFVGPPVEAIAVMGDKTRARSTVAAAGVPVVPAIEDLPADAADAQRAADGLGYPLLIKAAAGGGGKGMRVVRASGDFAAAREAAAREALSAFGDGRIFLERYFERARHVEVQVLADAHGTTLHLGERECSIQRRHQKIVEETPSPGVSGTLRERLTMAAVAAARSVGYVSAGTVEFLVTDAGDFYFLEMNTRLQVEHPITEWVSGVDLVHAQLRIAAGERLTWTQADLLPRGHAIECRVYAEDPAQHFLPSPGRILFLREPQGPGLRVDSGISAGGEVTVHYDPMLAKLSAWGATRDAARLRLIEGLRDYAVLGVTTNIAFLVDVLAHPAFAAGATHTHFIDEHLRAWQPAAPDAELAALAAALHGVLAPAAASGGGTRERAASPWQTLGAWRLGGAG
ncbi:MAG: biotin carboxylase N-terminal domain-containing protein [Deltaproteobacteria bacterium]|nr:biotin carboxylase N-terminal domain-containing protein [Deltaproteobacteria bacterium]